MSRSTACRAGSRFDIGCRRPQIVADPELRAIARSLFRPVDAVGITRISALVARAGFLAAHRAAVVDLLEDTIRATRRYLDAANHVEAVKIAADFDREPTARLHRGPHIGLSLVLEAAVRVRD